jgi:hypothetical protein
MWEESLIKLETGEKWWWWVRLLLRPQLMAEGDEEKRYPRRVCNNSV